MLHPKRTQGIVLCIFTLEAIDRRLSPVASNTYIKSKTDFSLLSSGSSLLVTTLPIHTLSTLVFRPSYILPSFRWNSSRSKLTEYTHIMHDGMSRLPSLLFCHCPGYVALHKLHLNLIMNLHFSRNELHLLTKCCSYVSIHFIKWIKINSVRLFFLSGKYIFGILVRRRLALPVLHTVVYTVSHVLMAHSRSWAFTTSPLHDACESNYSRRLGDGRAKGGRWVGKGWATSGRWAGNVYKVSQYITYYDHL